MTPYYADDTVTLWHGDCLHVLAGMKPDSIDAIVTDPPYGLGFMGKAWDSLPPGLEWSVECLRVLKPGGHLLAFGGTRTWHRLAIAIEDAGFEIRDSIAWMYGSGFPKSLDVSKAIDKAAGAERAVTGRGENWGASRAADGKQAYGDYAGGWDITMPATDTAKQWDGWGTALKPAFEPIVVARKPLVGTVAANVQEYGTGGLNIDACRIDVTAEDAKAMERANTPGSGRMKRGGSPIGTFVRSSATGAMDTTKGRWPANVVLDEHTAGLLDESRFFYTAKASKGERPQVDGSGHATVKPLSLMQWLIRLVTPPGGIVLDPFLGSGTTAEACIVEGFRCVGIERDESYLRLITARLSKPIAPVLFGLDTP